MALTTLDPTSALIVVDLQRGIVGRPTVHFIEGVVQNATRLAAAFRIRGLPVVLVNVTGGAPGRIDRARPAFAPPPDWAELIDELDAQSSDLRITKQRWGSFTGTTLDAQLRGLGVTQVVLCGISTSIGVESTARSAHELGYHVVLATDAMTDTDTSAHENSVQRIFPRLGETATTADIIYILGSETSPSTQSDSAKSG